MPRPRFPWHVLPDSAALEYAFFLSHVNDDAQDVARLKARIERMSRNRKSGPLSCFLDLENWPIANDLGSAMRESLLKSEYLVVWVTTEYLENRRGWAWMELAYAELLELSRNTPTRDPHLPFVVPVFREGVSVEQVARTPLLPYWHRNLGPMGTVLAIEEAADRLVQFYEQEEKKRSWTIAAQPPVTTLLRTVVDAGNNALTFHLLRSSLMRVLGFLIPVLFMTILTGSADEASPDARKVAGFKLQDHRGAWHSLDDLKENPFVVVAFLGTECPLAQQYAPRLVELAKEFHQGKVAFLAIDSNVQDSLTDLERYALAHKLPFPLLKDLGNVVADQFGAQRTPEIFVLDAERRIRYQGRIDDQYGIGYKRAKPTRRDLAVALEELLAGKPVSRPVVEAEGCFIGREAKRPATGTITYAKDIAPLLQKRCVNCHRAGDIAPFALTSYEDAAAWAETIRRVVRSDRMPPWHADPKHGQFSNDPRLSAAEKQLILDWVQNGTPRGESKDVAKPPAGDNEWRIGKPDLIIRLPYPYKVPATGTLDYVYYLHDPGFKVDRWVKASEVRPTSRSTVHHAVVFVQPPGDITVMAKGGFGFEMLAAYGPGVAPRLLKDGLAKFVPAGGKLVFQMHYTPCGVEQTDQTEIGLVFADPKEVKKEHKSGIVINHNLKIPPGAADHMVAADYQFRQDTWLFSMAPHMHLRGKSFTFEAHYPDGKRETLLNVPRWDFEWQHIYELAQPKLMPEGTKLICIALFDNSEANLWNPDPKATVHFGLQTSQEMMVGFFESALAEQDLSLPGPEVKPLPNGEYEVTFKYRPKQPANAVYLAGQFNEWKPDGHKMDGPDESGAYTTRLTLKKGSHEYKFVIDGKVWKHDPANRWQAGYFNNSVVVMGKGN